MPASSATERWEARFATSGEGRAKPSTWQLDALWREACREAQEADTAALRAAVARMREREQPLSATARDPRSPSARANEQGLGGRALGSRRRFANRFGGR